MAGEVYSWQQRRDGAGPPISGVARKKCGGNMDKTTEPVKMIHGILKILLSSVYRPFPHYSPHPAQDNRKIARAKQKGLLSA